MKKLLPLSLLFSLGFAVGGYAADSAAVWTESCQKCHGANGNGDTKMGKKLKLGDLTKAEVQAEFTDEAAFKAIKEGIKDESGKTLMKPIEGLTDEEITALVHYVRGLKQ
ncbi:MAG: cytochrome c [Opitutaceae bacterium]